MAITKDKVVYLHKKKSNGQVFYVGIGSSKRPYIMGKNARSDFWWDTMQKHGIDVEIINSGLSAADAKVVEKELICAFGRRDTKSGQLVNMTDGGDGTFGQKITKSHKLQVSKANKGRTAWNKGLKFSEATKQKMSASSMGILKGIKLETSTCPHCGQIGGAPQMNQWHFNNCKNK